MCKLAGYEPPTKTEAVKVILRGICDARLRVTIRTSKTDQRPPTL